MNFNLDKLDPQKKFVLKFSALTLGLFTLFFFTRNNLLFLLSGTAQITSILLKIFGIHSVVSGETISFAGVNFDIIFECTALFPIIIFLSAVISYPASWKNRGFGLLIGIPLIYFLNIIRLLILSFVGIKYPLAFQYVHSFLWESLFLVFVIIIFYVWVKKVGKK